LVLKQKHPIPILKNLNQKYLQSLPPRRESYIFSTTSHIYIYTLIFQKITYIYMMFTNWPIHYTISNDTIIFTITISNISIFTIKTTTIINNIISIDVIIINIIYFVTTIRICVWFCIIYICDNSVYITIWYWTSIPGNYKIFFIKNFNIFKIFHSKFTEMNLENQCFQLRITVSPIATRILVLKIILAGFEQHEHQIYIHIWQEVPIGSQC